MRHLYHIVTAFLLFFIGSLSAQGIDNGQGGASVPSAAAMGYGKYADIPVNQYTGTGNIAVPMFTVSDGPLSLSVGLQYHTGGLPVATPAGAVGLGWNLNYGGMISRTIRGLADSRIYGYYNRGYLNVATESSAIQGATGNIDTEPDIYYYTAGAYSGQFTFTANREIKTTPKSDVVISVEHQSNRFTRFTITTPDGTKYSYGKSADGTRTAYDYSVIGDDDADFVGETGWHLLDITTHDDKHRIDLFYEDAGYKYRSLSYCPGVHKYRQNNGSVVTNDDCPEQHQTNQIRTKLPLRIETPLQTIDFVPSINRDDLDDYNSTYRAKKIARVKLSDGDECVGYELTHGYFKSSDQPDAGKRLKLEAVQKYSCRPGATLDEPAWTFDYAGTVLGQGDHFFPDYEDTNIDHWGYYNYDPAKGDNGANNLTPPTQVRLGPAYVNYGSANRDSKTTPMLNGMLEKVTYPTGGSLSIEYEANEYYDAGQEQLLVDLMSCDQANCGGYESETSAYLPITQDIIDHGRWELCLIAFDDSGPNNGYDPNNNLARVEVINSSGTVIQTREFNGTTDACQSGTFPYVNLGPAIQAGHSYRFRVTSLNANATFTVIGPGTGSNKTAGGLRIKRTTVHDRVTTANDIVTDYAYEALNSTNSSGRLFRKPMYGHILDEHNVLFTPYSDAPLSGFNGAHIGYGRVVTSRAGSGSTEMTFALEDGQNVYEHFPAAPAKYKAESGAPLSSTVRKENGTAIATSSTTRYSGDNYELIGAAAGQSGVMFTARQVIVYNPSNSNLEPAYPYTQYQLRTGIYRPDLVTTTTDGVTTTMDYDYHPNNLLPDETETTNSDGKKIRTETVFMDSYVFHDVKVAFQDRNICYLPYRTWVYHDDVLVDGTRDYYMFFDQNGNNPSSTTSSGAHPRFFRKQRYVRNVTTSGSTGSAAYKELIRYTNYSSDGLVTDYYEPDWDPVTITYQNKLPVSKNFLGHITQYEYQSGGSLLEKVTAVDGTETNYAYDDLMRLERVEDACKGIVTEYDYTVDSGPGINNKTVTTVTYPADPTGRSQVTGMTTVNYTDGLGRPLQTVARELGPTANQDIVSARKYDNHGRVVKTYEPIAFTNTSNNAGSYRSPLSGWKHATTTYEASPLGRVVSVTPTDWYASDKTYGANAGADAVEKQSGGTYAAGALRKLTTTDANGNRLITFTDKRGRKILSRRTDAADTPAKRLDTYYHYDLKDRLVRVLPPGATTTTAELLYTYAYDREDRMTQKKIPGSAAVEYRYNDRDLLAATEDGILRAQGKWYAHAYDAFGREYQAGFYNSTPPSTITTNLVPDEPLIKTFYGSGHEKDKVKTVETKILNGGSDWLTTTNNYSTCGLLLSQTGNNHLPGKLNVTETTTYAYDGADNLTASIYNHQGSDGAHTITSAHHFDFAGRPTKNYFRVDGGTNTQLNAFVYNGKNEVITRYQGGTGLSGTQAFLQKIDYAYLENGMLAGINLDGLTGNQVSLPSWGSYGPTVNPGTPTTSNYDAKDLFYLELYRDQAPSLDPTNSNTPGVPRYNGDISYVASQVRGRDQLVFGLTYDDYDRMIDAQLYERASATAPADYGTHYWETAEYDERGNITALNRRGTYESSNRYYETGFDDLEYTYAAGTNRLQSIDDKLNNAHGYDEGSGNYAYDANGNTTYDPARNINITFNYLNLPKSVVWPNGQRIDLTYDAAGTLLTRTQKNASGTTLMRRDYVGGLEYLDGDLESVYHEEGRVKLTGSSQEWQYSLTDHLGNTRLIYADLNGNGVPDVPSEIIQEEHYFPFGMKMVGPWMGGASSDKTAYQYNGIEHVDDFGLDVNMATYRTLDPVVGRWWSVDPKAEAMMSMTPYGSMNSSPMTFADPDGDLAFLAAVGIGAALGVIGNGVGNAMNDRPFFQGAVKAGIFGAIGGAASFGIGAAATSLANGGMSALGVASFQAGAHAFTGGVLSAAQGGNFFHGAAAGAFSSAVGSGIGGLGLGDGWQILGGTISGGFGSAIAGGNFLQGAIQGAITSGLNHAIHSLSRVPYTMEALRKVYEKAYGEIPEHITLALGEDLPVGDPAVRGAYLDDDGNIRNRNRGYVGATTAPSSESGKASSTIYVSKFSFGNHRSLIHNLGHETFHANLFNAGIHGTRRHHATIYRWDVLSRTKLGLPVGPHQGCSLGASRVSSDMRYMPPAAW